MSTKTVNLMGLNPEWIEIPQGCNVTWNQNDTAMVEAENDALICKLEENIKNLKENLNKKPVDVTEVWVKFFLPFSLDLPNGTYPVRSNDFICTVLIRKKLTRDNASGMRGGMYFSDDRFGLANHTFVVARFVFNNPIKQDKISKLQLKQFSLKSINLLLNNCRLQTNEYYNHDIVTQDLARIEYQFLDDSGNLLPITSFVIAGGGIIKMNTSGYTIDERNVEAIRNNLSNDIVLLFEIELIKNSVDYFRFKNYRMSCIEIETAIEIIMNKILVDYLTVLQKIDPVQVDAYLKNCTISDFPRSQWEVIKQVLRKATFDTITGTDECQNWKAKCQLMRHKVVHAGYSPSEGEAEESLKSGIEFFKILLPYEKSLSKCNFSITFPVQKNDESVLENHDNLYSMKLTDFKDITSIDFNMIKKKIDEAMFCFMLFSEKEPYNAESWYCLAIAYAVKDEKEKCFSNLEKAVKIDNKIKQIAKQENILVKYSTESRFQTLIS